MNAELVIVSVSCAWPFGVSEMLETLPTGLPPTWTWSPVTIWLALMKTALTR